MLGSLIGAGAGLVGGLLGNKKDPAKEANKYLEQIPGQIKPYYDPYVNAGREALPTLMEQYRSLIEGPGDLFTKLTRGYQASPNYQFQRDEAVRGMNQAASAGGMVGSPQEQQELMRILTGLQSQDFGDYANQMMRMYGMGLGGMGDINQLGYGASGQMAQSLKDVLESQANLAYSGAASKNKNWADTLGGAIGVLGSIL
jgi:hypothetical protein